MGVTNEGPGDIGIDVPVLSGDFLLLTGGSAVGAVELYGGQIHVSAGGSVLDTAVGGYEYLSSGGTATGTSVETGGFEIVYDGGTASGSVLHRGGDQAVYSGGSAVSTTVSSGGIELVYNSGTTIGSIVENGGLEFVYGGGVASNTVVADAGTQNVSSGGVASGTSVGSNGAQMVTSGGTAMNTTVGSGGLVLIGAGGSATGTTIAAGGFMLVLPGGSAVQTSGAVISSGVVVVQDGVGVIDYANVINGSAIGDGLTDYVYAHGSAIATAINVGGSEYVFSAGDASGSVVGDGGNQFVGSGGATTGTEVDSAGIQTVSSGGTANFTVVSNGGSVEVLGFGTTSGSMVSSGGVAVVSSGATAIGTQLNGGFEYVSGGTAISAVVSAGGREVVSAGGTASGVVVSNGGTLGVFAGGTDAFNVISNGGNEFVLSNSISHDTVVSSGGTQHIYPAGSASLTVVLPGGMLDIRSLPYVGGGSASVDPASDWLTVSQGGQTYQQQLAGDYSGDKFQLSPGTGNGTLITVACFAAGTRIATVADEVAVEQLSAGDRVLTASGGTAGVIWLGHRRLDCRRHNRPEAVWPVRIEAHAFGPGRPHRELWLSPDHAVYVDGVLIPIRYLVNGATIAQQRVAEISYYHVELDRHAVLLADGLPAESYLDTGNRAAFANGGGAVMAHPDFARRIWEERGCARLVVSGKRVERVRRRLLKRAAALGHTSTEAPEICVMADGEVLPLAVEGRGYRGRLPPATRAEIRIVSRAWVPAHVLPGNDDHRQLGVALAGIRLDGRPIEPEDARLSNGWHDPEPGWRWTDGDAGLAPAGARELAFDLAIGGTYWVGRGAQPRYFEKNVSVRACATRSSVAL